MNLIAICPYCGCKNVVTGDSLICTGCNKNIDLDICEYKNKKNVKIKKIKHDLYMSFLNYDYNNVLKIIESNELDKHDLIIAYYTYWAHFNLNKEDKDFFIEDKNFFIEDTDFFNKETYIYTEEEKNIVLYHIFENKDVYETKDVIKFINKYASINKDEMINIVENGLENEKAIEKDLREELFKETIIPEAKPKLKKRKIKGLYLILSSLLIQAVLYLLIRFITKETMIYQMLIISSALPAVVFVCGLNFIIFKQSTILTKLLDVLFVLIMLYIFSYVVTIEYRDTLFLQSFLFHLEKIIYTPYDIVLNIIEGMESVKW